MSTSIYQSSASLIAYLMRESGLMRSPLLIFVVLASASRTAMIYLINETAGRGGPTLWLLLGLLGSAAVMLATTHWSKMSGVILVQALTHRMRAKMTQKLLDADVTFFLGRPQGEVFAVFADHIPNVASTTLRAAQILQAVLLLIFCLVYMIVQMPSAVIVVVLALLAGVASFVAVEKPGMRAERARHRAIVLFNDSITDLLRGYKELRLRHSRRSAMAARIDGQIAELENTTVRSERYFSYGNIAAMGSLAATRIAIVVVLPSVAGADSVTMLQLLTLVLFIFAPVEEMITGLPAIARSAVAFRIFRAMETTLAENAEAVSARDVIDNRPGFKTLELRGVTAHLSRNVGDTGTARDTFTLGPVDLTLYPGQSVFITGGNGMGKSTLLQLLTGLRHPDAGSIHIDGVEVTRDTVADYRGVFSAVFSEFYLFRHLFGLTEDERARLQEHIVELGLGEGVSITGDEFDSLSLSTGQMRRLALSIALAEQRPIIVLDEFAADQDPARRSFFYDVLVPRLARAGHCVIAVTHDEHCFDKCDRLIRMEDGKIASDELQTPSQQQTHQI